jgi:hypothetical protein
MEDRYPRNEEGHSRFFGESRIRVMRLEATTLKGSDTLVLAVTVA